MNFKKRLSSFLVILLLFSNSASLIVYAQEEVASGSIEIENTTEVTNDIVSISETGENEIVVETSLPEPTESPQPSPTSASNIETGDAISTTEVENNVNTNLVNSVIISHTLNIFLSEEVGDLDLSLLAENVVNKVFEVDLKTDEEISVSALGLNNFAYIENNIDTTSNTGDNFIEESGGARIITGDAYSIVSILNNVNTNMVDSTLHLVTINIFGVLEGNIVLPELNESNQSCENCSEDLKIENLAIVVNNIDSSAVTGQNSITSATDSAQINTGDAQSVVNVYNLVNTNWVNTVFKSLRINTYGSWQGDFLGWGEIPSSSEQNMVFESSFGGVGDQSCEGCFNEIDIQNQAEVINNINSSSNTGGNSLSSYGGEITTGNAYSSVSLFNIINSNILNSTGFIGFINIFGTLIGNIGGANEFFVPEVVEESIQDEDVVQSFEDDTSDEKEIGGELVLEANHNVGVYVLPGDTITFTAQVKNPGHGTLYETKVYIELFKDGESYGGSFFDLGEIKPFKFLTLSTGLVLSEDAEAGNYDAIVTATGVAGSDIHLSDSVTLPFKIVGFTSTIINDGFVAGVSASGGSPPVVLGANTNGLSAVEKRLIAVFSALLLTYLMGRGYQRREEYVFPVARKMGDYALRIGSLLT